MVGLLVRILVFLPGEAFGLAIADIRTNRAFTGWPPQFLDRCAIAGDDHSIFWPA